MKRNIALYKEVGETPLMALQKWRMEHPAYKDISASYAGRLDPMAEGKLLILFGEECKRQKVYTGLDKEYEIEVLLDVGSDTGDALGLVTYSGKYTKPVKKDVHDTLSKERGAHMRRYPVFSSKTVEGKPLFLHALSGTLTDIKIPEHEEKIYTTTLKKQTCISTEMLRERTRAFLLKVPRSDEPSKLLGADFRIKEVEKSWESIWEKSGQRDFRILTLRVTCGSGTYMRSLAPRIGEALGTNALALSIKRTKIGKYWNGLWLWQY